jgi:hypothetical protein
MATDVEQRRGGVLTALAVLLGFLAISNMFKPIAQTLRPESTAGFVFFGQRLHGLTNAIMGPFFGLLLAAYSYGVWTMKRWVLPLAIAYAGYVVLNLFLYSLNPGPWSPLHVAGAVADALGMIVYAAVAIGVSSGGALYLHRHRARLR